MASRGAVKQGRETIYHRLFKIGIWLKGIDGILEIIGGILFLIVSPIALNRYVRFITQRDLHNWFGEGLRHWAANLHHGSKLIGGAYLLGNGVIKIFLAAGILRGKLWCYPVAIVIISLFICLQIVRLSIRFSVPMLTGTVIDIAIVLLIMREYRRVKSTP
ncbi:MAG TPA: DUF2127 domain-containing protein [Pseudomonadales bacterium]|nr:DUF2127 domain-containing protein [Pseudomonadales bacterium]